MAIPSKSCLFPLALLLPAFVFSASPAADTPSTQPAASPTWPAPYPYPIGAGIQGLANGSANIVLADVLKTNPSKAIEGARDNAQLKVVQSLYGSTRPGETIVVYYHLLWIDDKSATLEPPKFTTGQRYLVFLTAPNQDPGDYELPDPILGILPDRPRQTAEVAAAIRAAHGDTRGNWSRTPSFTARLIAFRDRPRNQTPVISFHLEILGGDGTMQIDLSHANFSWRVTDDAGNAIRPNAPVGDYPAVVRDQKVVLDAQHSTRLPLSQFSNDIPKNARGYISILPGKAWSFDRSDHAAYFLSGSINIPPIAQNIWSGTLDLAKVPIPLD